jgi:acyl carrier protein
LAEDFVSPEDIQRKLSPILRDLFDDETLVAVPELTASDVEGWDSLNHVRLIMTIEREFKIRFSAAEVMDLKSLGELMDLIAAKTG